VDRNLQSFTIECLPDGSWDEPDPNNWLQCIDSEPFYLQIILEPTIKQASEGSTVVEQSRHDPMFKG